MPRKQAAVNLQQQQQDDEMVAEEDVTVCYQVC